MNEIWGKKVPLNSVYGEAAVKLLSERIEENRKIVLREFLKGKDTDHYNSLLVGSRFTDDEQIQWVLESNVPESEFFKETDHYIQRVLLGALGTDYYYRYEKDWG